MMPFITVVMMFLAGPYYSWSTAQSYGYGYRRPFSVITALPSADYYPPTGIQDC